MLEIIFWIASHCVQYVFDSGVANKVYNYSNDYILRYEFSCVFKM